MQVLDDRVGFVHRNAGVRVDEQGEHRFSMTLHRLWPKACAVLGAGLDQHVEIQHRERLPDLAAEGACLELIKFKHRSWPRADVAADLEAVAQTREGREVAGEDTPSSGHDWLCVGGD